MIKKVGAVAWIAVTLTVSLFLAKGYGTLPALGPLLEIREGIWHHREVRLENKFFQDLKDTVQVIYDQNGVPHLFAANEDDLYFIQGYLMASQRLFQMDLITRASVGRLSQWFGERTLELDEFYVRFGMRESAEKTLVEFEKDAATIAMIDSFLAGINAWIDEGHPLPAEYKIIRQTPERFDRLRVIAMAKSLTFNLASRTADLKLTKLLKTIGSEKVLDLFPERLPLQFEDYVTPGMTAGPERVMEKPEQFVFQTALKELPFFPLTPKGRGSNNWAVAPAKSSSGVSLMANDTHLSLSLPNIWYEAQLATPKFNVYGVGLVAVPGIVNGMNSKTAWGPTNGTTDVLDFYEVEFENETSLRYRFQDQWREASVRSEKIKVLQSKDLEQQVVRTHLGYLMHREGKLGLVANWMGHRTKNELKALRNFYEGQSYKDCLDSLESWWVPIQNFICVDEKHIAIQHSGYIPEREVGEGRFVMDGRSIENPFDRRIPEKLQPRLVDPADKFVASANQRIVDSRFPNYMGWEYEEPFRGQGIRKRLLEKEKLTVEDMQSMQNDAWDVQASLVLPLLLKHLKTEGLNEKQEDAVERLKDWDFMARASTVAPSIYKSWLRELKKYVFDSLHENGGIFPSDARVAWLLSRLDSNAEDSDRRWIDRANTAENETLSDVVTVAFQKSWEKLAELYGPDPQNWTWKNWNNVSIPHIARLDGFGSVLLEVDGSRESIRGINYRHGPVYKFIAEMKNPPEAWIQVPGGNEGDPFARTYERFVDDWAAGKMRKVEFYLSLQEARSKAVRVLEFQPVGKTR